MSGGYTYILSNRKNGALYVGATRDLQARLEEHKNKTNPKSHTARYDIVRLVYYEFYPLAADAFARERRFKKYPRQWKINLIERDNPNWDEIRLDLFD